MGRLPSILALLTINDASRKVIDNCEKGDLAEAVRQLAKAIGQAEEFRKPCTQ